MLNPKHLLEVRITIIMRREGYNFLNTLNDFQVQLKKYFKEEYDLDKIEDALHRLEETYIFTELNEDIARDNPELPEDYTF